MTNGFDARIPEKVGPGTSADTATAFAKTVSYPFLLTLNLFCFYYLFNIHACSAKLLII